MRVKCEVEEIDLDGDYGGQIESVMATCSRCGHSTESYGTSEESIKRCLVLLRQECPNEESNFYVADNE
jgi:hypothetical protein